MESILSSRMSKGLAIRSRTVHSMTVLEMEMVMQMVWIVEEKGDAGAKNKIG